MSEPIGERLRGVPGAGTDRLNDLLLLRPNTHCSNNHVVFFHGDIQNFQEEMDLHPEARQWSSWSLEKVGAILARRFHGNYIWVVQASRMYLHRFSCFKNFVRSTMFGAPEHLPYGEHSALRQLRVLLENSMQRAGLSAPLGVSVDFSLILVGFSKGCVVLNQMVYELAGARADPHMSSFVSSISDMFWLDGGHPGGSETWVTDREALRELAASGVSVHAHVTPYEVCDPMRAWVGREHKDFIRTLEELGSSPSNKLHFDQDPPSLHNHFRVLLDF